MHHQERPVGKQIEQRGAHDANIEGIECGLDSLETVRLLQARKQIVLRRPNFATAIMRLRAFKKFAPFVRDVKDWTEIGDVDTSTADVI